MSRKRFALDVLHHQVVTVLLAETIVDDDDVIVVEAREHLGLALESVGGGLRFLRIGEAVDHFGERAQAIREPRILDEVDHLHSAAAKRANYPITVANTVPDESIPVPTIVCGRCRRPKSVNCHHR